MHSQSITHDVYQFHAFISYQIIYIYLYIHIYIYTPFIMLTIIHTYNHISIHIQTLRTTHRYISISIYSSFITHVEHIYSDFIPHMFICQFNSSFTHAYHSCTKHLIYQPLQSHRPIITHNYITHK